MFHVGVKWDDTPPPRPQITSCGACSAKKMALEEPPEARTQSQSAAATSERTETVSGIHGGDVEVDGGGLLEMINNHLQAFRMLPWVIGGMGVLLLVRYSGMFAQYRRAADIPSHFLSRGATLRGVAVGAWPDGRLDVWHSTPGRRWLTWKHIPPKVYTSHQVLGVRLAAVTILRPETTYSWMYSNLIGRSVRLQPLHYSSNDDCVHCIVKYKKGYFHSPTCVNTQLLALGLATLEEPLSSGHHGSNSYHSNKELIAFLSKGVIAEGGAQRRGEGVWRGSAHEARWRKVARFLKLRN